MLVKVSDEILKSPNTAHFFVEVVSKIFLFFFQ
jgi:hypothetical protein